MSSVHALSLFVAPQLSVLIVVTHVPFTLPLLQVHEDGDEEDLEEHEMVEALAEQKALVAAEVEHDGGSDVSDGNDSDEEDEWQIEGHKWIGKAIVRVFGEERANARCTKWAEADKHGPALWHVVSE